MNNWGTILLPILIIYWLAMRIYRLRTSRVNQNETISYDGVPLVDLVDETLPNDGNGGDINLTISEATRSKDKWTFVAKAYYKDIPVGFKIEINSRIPASVEINASSTNPMLPNAIQFSTIGYESDSFLKALSEIYGIPSEPNFTEKPISATVFSLNTKAVDFNVDYLFQFKLFFENEPGTNPPELYLNINLQKNKIEIREKDEGNKKGIIELFGFSPNK
jgi:hypothetical protein